MFENEELEAIRREQGWSEASTIILLERFVKKYKLIGELLDFLREKAEEENDQEV
jgi:hypothetical protein